MFQKFLALVFAIGLLVLSELSWGENYDFRHTKWGMSQKELISAEEKIEPVERTENKIVFKTQILNKNFMLNYLFAQDKLIGALYKLDDNFLDTDRFIQIYLQFKKELTEKYGPPSKEITNWLNDSYKNNPKKWGLALCLGHIEYATFWKTQNTTIKCSLREENFNILCQVEYLSIEYSHLLEEVRKEYKIDLF
jgi:hypothetical protein